MKLFCDQCGYIEVAHYDGYSFGDRAFEGVMFEVKVVGSKLHTDGVEPTAKDYFDDFNQTKWLKIADESLEQVLKEYEPGVDLLCPTANSGHVVYLLNDDGTEFVATNPSTPVELKLPSIPEVLEKILTEGSNTKIRIFKDKPTLLSDYLGGTDDE